MNWSLKITFSLIFCINLLISCKSDNVSNDIDDLYLHFDKSSFPYMVEQFADLKILRYELPGWENLSLNEKKLVYFLTQAGLSGRDIMWDQNYRYNLSIRTALENVYVNFDGDRNNEQWSAFEIYLKRLWFSNGIHHHYSNAKINPDFSPEYLKSILIQTQTDLLDEAFQIIFNDKDLKKVVPFIAFSSFKSFFLFFTVGPDAISENLPSITSDITILQIFKEFE